MRRKQGSGPGCAPALARNGVAVTITARSEDARGSRERARAASGGKVTAVAGDITTPEGRAAALAACPDPDILVNNAGGPPPGDSANGTRRMAGACNANMITAIMLIKATVDGMIARRFGRIVNITSSSVKAPIPHLGLSNGARAGLTGFVAGIARQTVEHNVTINKMLPGRFDTDRLRAGLAFTAQKAGRAVAEVEAEARAQVPARRFGTPEEFGELCAFVCSAQASYITGQNSLIDGGLYPGTYSPARLTPPDA